MFGDETSPPFDDAYDTVEWQDEPLYIARLAQQWFLVWGTRRSQSFPYQIRFDVALNQVLIQPFAGVDQRFRLKNSVPAQWNNQIDS